MILLIFKIFRKGLLPERSWQLIAESEDDALIAEANFAQLTRAARRKAVVQRLSVSASAQLDAPLIKCIVWLSDFDAHKRWVGSLRLGSMRDVQALVGMLNATGRDGWVHITEPQQLQGWLHTTDKGGADDGNKAAD